MGFAPFGFRLLERLPPAQIGLISHEWNLGGKASESQALTARCSAGTAAPELSRGHRPTSPVSCISESARGAQAGIRGEGQIAQLAV